MVKIVILIIILMNLLSLDAANVKQKLSQIMHKKDSEYVELKKPNAKESPGPTKPELFHSIKLPLEQAKEEADFWSLQAFEHALFMFLGFTDPSLKERAKKIHKELGHFRNEFKNNRSTKALDKLLPLLKKERELQLDALNKLKAGQWIGWLFPSLLKHMVMEQDYFVDKLNNIKYSPEDEKKFWKDEAKGRLGVTAHLLDPSQDREVKEATKIIDKYFNVPSYEKNKFNESALQAIKEVNEFGDQLEKNKGIESIISKTLSNHEKREGERAAKILSKINELYKGDLNAKKETRTKSKINK